MTFAALPLWALIPLLGVALLAVIALYLLRRTPKQVVVSNVALWLKAAQRAKPKWLSATRIPLLSLLVSLLIAALLVADLGDPRWGRGVRGTTVIVLAAGESMGARDGATTRLAQATREVRRWVDRATASGKVAVVRAGIRPTVLLPLTESDDELDPALRGLRADDGPADLGAALALADRIAGASGDAAQIVVVADELTGIATQAPQLLVPIGEPADTVAITALAARRDPIAVGEYAVFCQVTAFTSRRAHAKLVIKDRDTVISERELHLAPNETVTHTAQGFSSQRGELTATLTDLDVAGGADALATDDAAYAVAPPLRRTSVLVVSAGNRYLDAVLAAHGALDVTRTAPGSVPAERDLDRFDVVILDRVAPQAALHHHGLLVIDPPANAGFEVGDTLSRPRVTGSLASHGALDGVRLDGVRVTRAETLIPEPGDAVLMRASGDALMIARDRDGHRALALGFALADTDLPSRIAFPLMMHSTLHWLAGTNETLATLSRRPGAPLVTGRATAILGPRGEALAARGGEITDTTRAGIYHVEDHPYAYSAADTAAALPIPGTTELADATRALPSLSVLVAALLLALLALEWLLVHRGRLD